MTEMKNLSSHRKIIDILENLKDTEPKYPPELMKARRKRFARQAVSLIAAKTNEQQSPSDNRTISSSSTIGTTTLKTLLIFAIFAGTGVTSYIHRDKIVRIVGGLLSSKVEYVTSPVASIPPSVIIPDTGGETAIPVSISPIYTFTESPSPIGTISVTVTPSPMNKEGDQVASTPKPKNNNGNHYGQTPKPERTKEKKPTKSPRDK